MQSIYQDVLEVDDTLQVEALLICLRQEKGKITKNGSISFTAVIEARRIHQMQNTPVLFISKTVGSDFCCVWKRVSLMVSSTQNRPHKIR